MEQLREYYKREAENYAYHLNEKETKALIDGLLEDEAKLTNLSKTQLIDNHILNDFIPKDDFRLVWAYELYSKKPDSLQNIMMILFAFLGKVRLNSDIRINIGKKLIKYSYLNKCLYNINLNEYSKIEFPTINSKYLEELIKELIKEHEKISNRLKFSTNGNEEELKKFILSLDIRELKRIYKQTKITDLDFMSLYLVILDNWETLFCCSYVYRLLEGMASLQTWENNEKTRLELIEILKETNLYN